MEKISLTIEKEWHTLPVPRVFELLGTSEHGLSMSEAARRLEQYGLNTLLEEKVESWFIIFLRQFKSPLIYILLVAAFVLFLLGDYTDTGIIILVLLVNAIVGAVQEGRAKNTLQALKKFTETQATVIRDARQLIVPDRELVPGDIIVLEEGIKVPADGRVVESQGLKLDEAALTGESNPVHKVTSPIKQKKVTTAEQVNRVFRGTNVVSGHGQAVVVSTGLNTVIGRITKEIATIDTEIPLKNNISNLARLLILGTTALSFLLFTTGIIWFNHTPLEMFKLVVALAVSFIPEGLPVALTLILVTGVWRMAKRNALVKKLQAVESLGQARILAVDKTGTLTKNELVVQLLWVNGKTYEVTGAGYEPKGEIKMAGEIIEPLTHQELVQMGKLASLVANARLAQVGEEGRWQITGDPTDAAIMVLGEKIGFHKEDMEKDYVKRLELPFDYRTKYHAVQYQRGSQNLLVVAGAAEVVLKLSSHIWLGGHSIILSKKKRRELEKKVEDISSSGLRVVALAMCTGSKNLIKNNILPNLNFVGFMGMRDALRPEVHDALERTQQAGIRVVMITGDHKLTAETIAREAGIFKDGNMVLSGEEVESLSIEELAHYLDKVTVFARVTPEHKFKIIEAYKKRGEIIAMTGDGVNDALSLVAADLGVAMGQVGTEVAKEASDIVLLDDNFGSIVSAVEEGRSIYRTIRKVLQYLLSTNLGEVLLITVALFMGYPLPLLAAQIIWLNFVTDGFLVAALAMEPKEEGLLSWRQERTKKYLVDKKLFSSSAITALVIATGSFIVFQSYLDRGLVVAQTAVLTTMAVFQWFRAFSARSEDKSIFRQNPFSNLYLLAALAVVISLQTSAIYAPFMQKILRTAPLGGQDWLIIISVSATVIVVDEVRKFFIRQRKNIS